jgi:putative glutathione S-transferase
VQPAEAHRDAGALGVQPGPVPDPGFGDTIDFEQVKQHYYGVHAEINPTGIVPKGPDVSHWLDPHGREELGGRPFGNGTPPDPVPEDEQVPPLT